MWRCAAAAVAAIVFVLSAAATAQDSLDRADKIKAAYLYNLGRYVEWMEPAATDGQPAPFVIGLMAPETLSDELRLIAETKTLDGRPIVVRRFASSHDVGPCHLLYLPRTVPLDVQRDVIQQHSGKSVLFVGEIPEFHRIGGIVLLQEVDNRIRLVVSQAAARRENLKFSAKLLQVAQVAD